MGAFNYTENRLAANVTFPAHKFPYTTSVYYQCNVHLCALEDPDCQRVSDIKVQKMEVLTEIYVLYRILFVVKDQNDRPYQRVRMMTDCQQQSRFSLGSM